MIVGLIGNPNAGKTTLFNALTGARQEVGNWPGVTVERKSGFFTYATQSIEVIDLPGVYTLNHFAHSAMDESIARDYILSGQADVLVNVLDGANLERHLYLTAQLLEMNVPMILVINMMDVLDKQGYRVDVNRLAQRLGCPVIAMSHKAQSVDALKACIVDNFSVQQSESWMPINYPVYPPVIQDALKLLCASEPEKPHALYYALRQIETQAQTEQWEEDPDILIASARYTWAHDIAQTILYRTKAPQKNRTSQLDQWILNRFLGIPIFLGVIYCLFLVAIHVGGVFQDYFDQASDAIFVQGTAQVLQSISAPAWLIAMLAAGVGKGLNTTLTFIPVLAVMFFCLSFLEASGYMVRAAFVMDRLMRFCGLPGKALVPMIIGFGCNVPAIMSARTLEDPRDRLLTIIMSPFMSCSARLAIFSVFVAAFFPSGGQNIVFALYVIGILMAMLTGFILRKTLVRGEPSPWVMELPEYHWPTFKALIYPTMLRTQHFLIRAGKVIVPVCLILGVLNGLTIEGHFSSDDANSHSLLSLLGQAITPIFSPMGITTENWPATVGLMTGVLAKEVVIATLNTLYVQVGHLGAISDVYGEMSMRFSGPAGAFAYLLFVLLYIPCASTMAVIKKELNTGWMLFSIGWSTALAYSLAVIYYQSMTFGAHPHSSLLWFFVITLFYGSVLKYMTMVGNHVIRY